MASTIFQGSYNMMDVYQNYGTVSQALLGTAEGFYDSDTMTTRFDGNYNNTEAGGSFTFLFVPVKQFNLCQFSYVSTGYYQIDIPPEKAYYIEYYLLGRPEVTITTKQDYGVKITPIFRGVHDQNFVGYQFSVLGPQPFVFELIFKS